MAQPNRSAFWKIIVESARQALQHLTNNRLRTLLSLLGIFIGIFCIIGVEATVDSLEDEVRGSFNELGEDVVYVSRFDWDKDPSQDWWRYLKRPNPGYADYEAIKEKAHLSQATAYHAFIGTKTAKYRNNSVEGVELTAITHDYDDVIQLNLVSGRYFSLVEYERGMPKAILGYHVAQSLFGNIDPLGKEIKISGTRYEVIGLLDKSGESIVQINNEDNAVYITYTMARQIADLDDVTAFGSGVMVKAAEREQMDEMKDELIAILRSQRQLKPLEENNFSLNTLSVLSGVLDNFFGVIQRLGLIIGIFAIFVGAFSVANIMFVSVKERTSLIGIKKAIGARKLFILLEFLIESIVLCILGGLVGLLFIIGFTEVISQFVDFDIQVSVKNILSGLLWSLGVGIAAGIIPALSAANMDPVEAMRA